MAYPDNAILIKGKNEMSYQITKKHERNVSAYYHVKDATGIGYILHDSNLCDILEKAKLWRLKSSAVARDGGGEEDEHIGIAQSSLYTIIMNDGYISYICPNPQNVHTQSEP